MKTRLHNTLKKYFGFDSFLDHQEEIVEDVLTGRDVCTIMPTGAGKSLCYQLPLLMRDGYSFIVYCLSVIQFCGLSKQGKSLKFCA